MRQFRRPLRQNFRQPFQKTALTDQTSEFLQSFSADIVLRK